jgi:putative inorganic carbon (HCO3(-)) transporter
VRDIVLTAIIGALLIAVLKHPVIGAYLWAWLSLMNPHKLTYGFAFSMPFAMVTAAVTLVMLAGTSQRRMPPPDPILTILYLMLFWMTVTSFFALADRSDVIDRWVFVMKIQVMLIATVMLVRDARQLRILIWVVAMSVGYFGIKGGIFTVMTGGGFHVWGPPGLLEGNNELAVGLVMMVPMFYFLRQTETRKWVRHLLLGVIIALAFSILGSQSRGALLALVAMAFVLGLRGKYPVRTSLLLTLLLLVAVAFMPDSWVSRMETINTYSDDASAMSRIWTWKTMWNAAVDRPFLGVGFRADNLAVFSRYAPAGPEWDRYEGTVFVAHSIYFQMLGEHGFLGLGLFLLFWVVTWVRAGRVAKLALSRPDLNAWVPDLMRMVQVSLIGYAVGGAFLSLAYLDLTYYLAAFVVMAGALVAAPAVVRAGSDPPAQPGHEPRANQASVS